ncbi:non-hydrolyzing UDP-N-acetylglucosamine 2-epimerase [Enterovirga rhinocerotis]|nr:UDP-N-acetylglucosamine 2-epimerase (non-hydrolyzing) [Enterovirga rhinocerotis]
MINADEKKHVVCVVGTRPEAIKMAPVIAELKLRPWCRVTVVGTGQHREMMHQALGAFGLGVDVDLDVMTPNQRLSTLSSRILSGFDAYLQKENPDLVLAQGDTTTVMAVALCCFHAKVPLGHVEAGLRTSQIDNPFPEEFNRRIASLAAALHFAPTGRAKEKLLAENYDPATVFVTGNTVIDALLTILKQYPESSAKSDIVLVTMHRRENHGLPMERVCESIARLHDRYPHLRFRLPVHPNPAVKSVVEAKLKGLERIVLSDPLSYGELACVMRDSLLILTDSGGIQEEAPILRKPVLVLRSETERPEALDAGVGKLVGTDSALIEAEVDRLLTDEAYYASMASGASPYGDGQAAQRIADRCAAYLGLGGTVMPDFA